MGVFYIGGVLRGFDRFAEKAPVEGFFFKNKDFRKKSGAGVFFLCGFTGFLRAPALQSASDCFCIVLGPLLSLISRT